MVLAAFLGLTAVILIAVAFGSHRRRGEEEVSGQRETSEGGDVAGHGEKNPFPPLLVFIYVGVVLFALAYLIIVGIKGPPF
jgi:hypothetical protein